MTAAISGRDQTIGTALLVEREHLLPLAPEGMDLAWISFPAVSSLGTVQVGTQVQAKVYACFFELWQEGRCVARHERCYGRHQQVLDPEHYLDVISRKPGAVAGSRPLEQQRRAGLWPDSFDQIWQSLMLRHGKPTGTTDMVEPLKLSRQFVQDRLRLAIETALKTGCRDAAAAQTKRIRQSSERLVTNPDT